MTTITIERAVLLRALEALRPATAPNGAKRDAAFEELRAALAAPAQPDQAFVCSLGCTTECLARQHGVPSECPSLPRQPVITPATAQAAEIARLRSESEERLQNCAALVAEVERLRKDAERYQWLAEYLVSDDESYDDAIVAATTVKEVDSVIDNAMGASPWAHCFCGVRPQAQHVWQAATDAALSAPATAPAWNNVPTCGGLWLCDEGDENPYRFTCHDISMPLNPHLVGEGERWYGPIPEDKP